MIDRQASHRSIEILEAFPVLGLIGPRQIGKTTLALNIRSQIKDAIYIDLESPADQNLLTNAEEFLTRNSDKLIIIDEVQRQKSLFPILRSVIDRNRRPGRFMLLGSASPELIRDASESLAGRIAYLEMSGLNVLEVGNLNKLWLNGSFPDVFLNEKIKTIWYQNFIRTYLERDLPMLGFPADSNSSKRLWSMLAHLHGQTINYSMLAKSLEVSPKTVKSYVEFLEKAFLIRLLPSYPWCI